ncbi:MAG: hypothetical protein H6811_12355 [Phycisphaeraceae bacterium]|nr:hypothetical protein [Phycisphaeraceae bacterium]
MGRRSLLGLCLISALGVQSWAASADAASGLEAITKGVQTAPVLQGRDAALPTLDPRLTPTLAEPEPEEETQEAPVASLPELSAARPGCPGTSLCRTCRGRQLTGVHFRARARAPPRA